MLGRIYENKVVLGINVRFVSYYVILNKLRNFFMFGFLGMK